MSTTATYRKTKTGEWVAYGPLADLEGSDTVIVTKRDGTAKTWDIDHLGEPFTVNGVDMVYAHLVPGSDVPFRAATTADTPRFPPTAEQQTAIDLFLTGESLVVHAYAGAGKTSTLVRMAEQVPEKKGLFTAFNRKIVTEAAGKMPSHVKVTTAHKLALDNTPGPFRERFFDKDRNNRMKARQIAHQLGIGSLNVTVTKGDHTETKNIPAQTLASHVMGALRCFCQSADPKPTVKHFPYLEGIDPAGEDGNRTYANNQLLARHLIGTVEEAWADLSRPDGRLPYQHAHYLKQYELSGPRIDVDFVMVDEAQDLSPVLMSIIEQQTHCQIILVGDSFQAINGFTGAVDALERTQITQVTHLTKSFRFGQQLADEANKILVRLGSDKPIVGNDTITTTVGKLTAPRCYLTRTNAAAVRRVLTEIEQGGKPLLIGDVDGIVWFCEAALDLQAGRSTSHPELACFSSWTEVEVYVSQEKDGEDLKLMVSLINEFGAVEIIDALRNMPASENDASVVISTAHKVKGCEWDTVQLGDDFPSGVNKEGDRVEPSVDELRLLYVAVTRGQTGVDFTQVGCLNPPAPKPTSDAVTVDA